MTQENTKGSAQLIVIGLVLVIVAFYFGYEYFTSDSYYVTKRHGYLIEGPHQLRGGERAVNGGIFFVFGIAVLVLVVAIIRWSIKRSSTHSNSDTK